MILLPGPISILEVTAAVTPILTSLRTKSIKRAISYQAIIELILHSKGMLRECRLFVFALLTFNLRSSDSSAEANFGIRTDCSSNSESPKSKDQIDNTGNTLSSTHKAHSSPQRYATGMSLVCISSFHH